MYYFMCHQNVEGVPYFGDSTRSVRPQNRQRPSIAYRLMPIAMPQKQNHHNLIDILIKNVQKEAEILFEHGSGSVSNLAGNGS